MDVHHWISFFKATEQIVKIVHFVKQRYVIVPPVGGMFYMPVMFRDWS